MQRNARRRGCGRVQSSLERTMSIPRTAAACPTFYAAQHNPSTHPSVQQPSALQLCHRAAVTTTPGTRVSEAARLMRDERVGALVVLDAEPGSQQTVAGILTDRDITTLCVATGADPQVCTVGEIMTRDVVAAQAGDPASQLLALMQSRGVRRLPVVDASRELLGILTLDDLVGNVAAQVQTLGSALGATPRRPA